MEVFTEELDSWEQIMTANDLNPEVLERLKKNTMDLWKLQRELEERLAFLRLQAQLPLRALLLGTTAIMTGRVKS